MNRILFCILAFASIGQTAANAQIGADTSKVTLPTPLQPYSHAIGIRGGVGVSTISSINLQKAVDYQKSIDSYAKDYSYSKVAEISYSVGLFYDKPIGQRSGVMVEANLYSSAGSFQFKYNGDTANPNYYTTSGGATIRQYDLNIPVLYRFTISKPSQFYVFAGPSFNFHMGGKLRAFETKYDISKPVNSTGYNNSDTFALSTASSFRPGLMAGFGIIRSLAGKPLHIQLRYSMALTGMQYYTDDNNYTFLFKGGITNFNKSRQDFLKTKGISLDDFKTSSVMISLGWGLFATPTDAERDKGAAPLTTPTY